MCPSDQAPQDAADYPQQMGPELGPTYHALFQDLSWLHLRWHLYRQVFVDPTPPYARVEQQLDLLTDTAPSFFYALSRILWYDVLGGLAKITDSERSGRGKENLSLRRLPGLIEDEGFRVTMKELVDSAVNACSEIRDWRNSQIAHRDLAPALNASPTPLPGIHHQAVEDAFQACRRVLNETEVHFGVGQVLYEYSLPSAGDGRVLLFYLRHGLEDVLRAERRATGFPESPNG
jgi:hypothetical protein